MNELIRKCPLCGHDITYGSKDAFNMATKRNSVCKSCSTKKQYTNDPLKNKGSSNGRYGKTIKEIAIAKYGEEVGLQKYQEWSKKLAAHGFQEGKLNPSFGKSSPANSGKSYKGWYKNIFFRSTLELAFLLKYEAENNCLPHTGDNEKYRLIYKGLTGKDRTYVPDFICLINNIVYELKCATFVSYPENVAKAKVAETKYHDMGLLYQIITEQNVDNFNCDSFLSKLKHLYETNVITLTDKSVIKLNNRLNKGK